MDMVDKGELIDIHRASIASFNPNSVVLSNGNTLNFAAIPDFLPLRQAGKGKSSKLSQPQARQYIQGDTLL